MVFVVGNGYYFDNRLLLKQVVSKRASRRPLVVPLKRVYFAKKKNFAYRLAESLRLSQRLHMSAGMSEKNSKKSYLIAISS